MIKSPRMFNEGRLVVTLSQKEALLDIRERYDQFELTKIIMKKWECWNNEVPQKEEDTVYRPLGDIELSDLITAAITGRFTAEVSEKHIIERCMEDAYGHDREKAKILGEILTLFNEYNCL